MWPRRPLPALNLLVSRLPVFARPGKGLSGFYENHFSEADYTRDQPISRKMWQTTHDVRTLASAPARSAFKYWLPVRSKRPGEHNPRSTSSPRHAKTKLEWNLKGTVLVAMQSRQRYRHDPLVPLFSLPHRLWRRCSTHNSSTVEVTRNRPLTLPVSTDRYGNWWVLVPKRWAKYKIFFTLLLILACCRAVGYEA